MELQQKKVLCCHLFFNFIEINFHIDNDFYDINRLDDVLLQDRKEKIPKNLRNKEFSFFQNEYQGKVFSDSGKNVKKIKGSKGNRKVTTFMNFFILFMAITLLSLTIYIQVNASDHPLSESGQNEI